MESLTRHFDTLPIRRLPVRGMKTAVENGFSHTWLHVAISDKEYVHIKAPDLTTGASWFLEKRGSLATTTVRYWDNLWIWFGYLDLSDGVIYDTP